MIRLFKKIVVVASVGLIGCSVGEDDQGWGSDSLYGTETDAACPVGVTCVDSLPFTDENTTAGSGAVFDGYSCAPETSEPGPEQVYRVDLATEGLLVASLEGLGAGVDVDVHILDTLDQGTCIDRGNWDAAALLKPGRYWIVVDSWGDSTGTSHEGSYQLNIALTTAADHLSLGLYPSTLGAGLRAFAEGWGSGDTEELEYGIIDYRLPSTDPRFFVLDLRRGEMLYAELVTHGAGSQDPDDKALVASLSNVEDSHQSSIGLVRVAETYWGANGYSARIDGLEPGFNDNDRHRAIVVHKADYATQSYVDAHGYLGTSWGCPAVDPAVSQALIDTLNGGRLLLKYFDDSNWLANSSYVAL